jgi:hypothetical protein
MAPDYPNTPSYFTDTPLATVIGSHPRRPEQVATGGRRSEREPKSK